MVGPIPCLTWPWSNIYWLALWPWGHSTAQSHWWVVSATRAHNLGRVSLTVGRKPRGVQKQVSYYTTCNLLTVAVCHSLGWWGPSTQIGGGRCTSILEELTHYMQWSPQANSHIEVQSVFKVLAVLETVSILITRDDVTSDAAVCHIYTLGCYNMGPTGATADRDANFIHIQLIAEQDFIACSQHEGFSSVILPPAGSSKLDLSHPAWLWS